MTEKALFVPLCPNHLLSKPVPHTGLSELEQVLTPNLLGGTGPTTLDTISSDAISLANYHHCLFCVVLPPRAFHQTL